MQKLLFILICLLLSFEVRSENDDLTGKKLVCESPTYIWGFEFLDTWKVKKTTIDIKEGISYPFFYKYETTPVEIKLGGIYTINRLTLKFNRKTDCRLIEDNFDSYMNDRLEIIVNEIKSKRKI